MNAENMSLFSRIHVSMWKRIGSERGGPASAEILDFVSTGVTAGL